MPLQGRNGPCSDGLLAWPLGLWVGPVSPVPVQLERKGILQWSIHFKFEK